MQNSGKSPMSKSKVSPKKKQSTDVNGRDLDQFDDRENYRNLNERDVELDHLKTTIIAMNEKIILIDDIKDEA